MRFPQSYVKAGLNIEPFLSTISAVLAHSLQSFSESQSINIYPYEKICSPVKFKNSFVSEK